MCSLSHYNQTKYPLISLPLYIIYSSVSHSFFKLLSVLSHLSKMKRINSYLILLLILLVLLSILTSIWAHKEEKLLNPSKLNMFVDELQDMPKIRGFDVVNGVPKPKTLNIGMFSKEWVSNYKD